MNTRPSTIVLLGVNMIPLAGVVFLGWRVLDVMLLYWAENVVIGIINVFRMAMAKGGLGVGDRRMDAAIRAAIEASPDAKRVTLERIGTMMKITMIPFFIVHYGVFCWGHLTSLNFIFDPVRGAPPFISLFGYDAVPILIGIGPIAISHLYSFFANFIGKREYLHTTPSLLMHRPYGRVIALHVAIIAGGALVDLLGGQVYLLVILVLAKTLMDAKFHTLERDKFADAGQDARHRSMPN